MSSQWSEQLVQDIRLMSSTDLERIDETLQDLTKQELKEYEQQLRLLVNQLRGILIRRG